MSEFSVHRTADTIPALRYCLVLDGTRIAGGKPDYRGDNHLISWQTDETYGPVDDLMAENAKLRDSLKALMMGTYAELCADRDQPQCRECSMRRGDDTCATADAMELLGIDMYGEPL